MTDTTTTTDGTTTTAGADATTTPPPPLPPSRTPLLLWIDTETTGADRDRARLLEIGMVATPLDASGDIDEFHSIVRPDRLDVYECDIDALRMHLDNGLLDDVWYTDPDENAYQPVANDLTEWLDRLAEHHLLIPAGTNVDWDLDVITRQLAPSGEHGQWLRERLQHRKLDLSSFRIARQALADGAAGRHATGRPHEGAVHRVMDCIRRDRNEYAVILDELRAVRTEGDPR
ncbi:exonuclease domain-containing protein [Bifidobacterium samirii]|uniref:Ribonuclease n=1 Tax=Bifidobacterium samirii TaxID=2306974 RepID=A0A430FJJ7_9BIFI|nr:exonuclease domain-containing protein [Bifidobacterium samirii]RSX53006.1 ribonuclease [Bifidobacterium samirii]